MTSEDVNPAPKKPRKKSQKQLLIQALLYPTAQINWPLEMRWLGALLKKHEDPEFWFFLAARHKVWSLKILLAQPDNIFRYHLEYTKQTKLTLNNSQNVNLSKEKVGEDIIVPQKPKTLIDFINS